MSTTWLDLKTRVVHTRVKRLLPRYIVGPSLSRRQAAATLAHLKTCDSCREQLQRLESGIAASLGVSEMQAMPHRVESLFEATWARHEAETQGKSVRAGLPGWPGLLAAGACALVLLLVVARTVVEGPSLPGDETVNARAGDSVLPDFAVGLSAVDPTGVEHEVLETANLCMDDSLRLYARSRNDDYAYVMLFAVQPHSDELLWYFPSEEERFSLLIETFDEPWQLDDDIPMKDNHTAGELLVCAVFSHQPLDVSYVNSLWFSDGEQSGVLAALDLLDHLEGDGYGVWSARLTLNEPCRGGRP